MSILLELGRSLLQAINIGQGNHVLEVENLWIATYIYAINLAWFYLRSERLGRRGLLRKTCAVVQAILLLLGDLLLGLGVLWTWGYHCSSNAAWHVR